MFVSWPSSAETPLTAVLLLTYGPVIRFIFCHIVFLLGTLNIKGKRSHITLYSWYRAVVPLMASS